MTEVEQPPQNGIDLSGADDDENSKSRPADIEQDMREMERRKRVEAIMSSKLFREELERIVDCARDSGNAAGILQQLSDIVGVPSSRVGSVFKTSTCMLPINDIRGVESIGYAKGEKILRCKLAATFRLLDLYGWTHGLGAQITARLKVDQEYFLVNPYGLLYYEITASSLNKVDMQGNIVEQGTTNFGVNKNNFMLHSIVHAARPDIRCAIYIGCSSVVAISSLKTGLLPLTKDACVLGELSTYSYTGYLHDEEERDKLVRNLGPNSKVMLLTNHGALCCGETIEEAFFAACHIVQACETQLKLLPVGLDNLILIPDESRKIIYEQSRRPPKDLEKKFDATTINDSNKSKSEEEKKECGESSTTTTKALGQVPKWRVGGAEFEALMRMLDNAGYRTGYIYRHPLVKTEPPKPKNDVELPPAVSSLGYLLEEEELFRQGIWKKGDLRKGGDRSRWLNSPNVYQKVEVLETGTPDPKKITKWVAEDSPTHSTPVRIDDPLQFVPVNTNPKEFKRVQQQIKDNRRADKISAGPQSHILEGVTWDEANRIKDATVSSAGDHVVLMGAASKGIIQRGFQHNATVYKAPYAKNPFDNVTDDELNEYKRTVERKKKSIHGEYTDTDFSESEPLSSLQTTGAQQAKQTTTTTTTITAAISQSEPEDISEHQIMRIQTQQAPVPSQPEVVLSDASLSFINGERLHMATNRKPPTGRDNEFQLPQDHSTNESLDIEFHSLILTKYHSAVDDDEGDLIKEEEQKSYCTSYQQTSILKSRDLQKQNINSISESKDNLFIQTQKGKENLISYFPNYINTQEYCHNKQQGSGNDSLNLKIRRDLNQLKYCYINGNNKLRLGRDFSETCNNSIPNNINYSNKLGKNSEDKRYFIQCCTPKICSAVIESAMKYNNQYEINDEQDFKLNENLYQYLSNRFNVTSSKAKDIKGYRKLDCPYRTVSHFGFNLPLQEPAPDHKHSINFENKQKYIPLMRTASYEEIFSSARYLELCEYCFEYLVRLKPELMKKYKTKLRNLAKHSACNKLNFRERYFTSSILNRDHHNITNEGKYKFEFGDHNDVAFSFKLDPIIEIDESFNDLQTQSISNTSLNEKVNRINLSEQARSDKIFITPNTISSQINLSKDVDDNNLNLLSHSSTSFNANGNIEDYNLSLISCNNINVTLDNFISLTEIWEFDDWLNTVIDMNQNIKLQNSKHCENVSNVYYIKESPRKLMNREERWRRKLEFQEIWEDHVNFAQNRECSDMELAENGEQQDVSIEQNNQSILFDIKEEEEVFNGHCLLFPYFSLFNKKCFDENHKNLQEINNLSEGCTLLTTSNMTYNIAEIKSSDENLFSPNFDSSNIANTEDYESLRKKISRKSKVCDSYENIRNQASVVDEKHGRNSLIDFSKMSFNENRDEFSPLERTILEKIHTNNLSKNNTIFRKIESSIRNKMTPYKMGGSLIEEKTVFLENRQKIKDKENENLNLLSAVKPIRLPCSLTSHIDNIELPSYKLKKTNSRIIESHNKPPKSTENHKKIISISPYLQSVNLNEKSKCRNFILENIRNASIPRQKAQIKRRKNNVEQKLKKIHSITPTPSTNKFGSTKKLPKNLSHKAETPQQFIYSRKYNIPSTIYSFQSKLVKGSPRLWISIPQSPSTQNQSIISPKLSSNSSKSSNIRDSDVNITIVDEEINALGKEIEQIQPRLENYKRKLDDFGNRVTECVHNINECISTHEKTISEQQKLKDRIVLHQYAEDIMCRVQTFSLSETED